MNLHEGISLGWGEVQTAEWRAGYPGEAAGMGPVRPCERAGDTSSRTAPAPGARIRIRAPSRVRTSVRAIPSSTSARAVLQGWEREEPAIQPRRPTQMRGVMVRDD